METLEDRAALVTGGSRGIGRAICLSLAAEGAQVAVNFNKNES
ncbi:MAG TPA: SDR family NAD(P)-dependent oxidoreductase, partial [Dehalococcoidia bacterium]|nr:SDR family NAD(P)-dependent oxidoreductase [Dehalococcoidia bacterium]